MMNNTGLIWCITISHDTVTYELVLSLIGNFIDNRLEIAQIIQKCQISTSLKVVSVTFLLVCF